MRQLTLWESAGVTHGTYGRFHPSSMVGKVHYIYSRSQRAIDEDEYLVQYYEQLFGELQRTSSVERCGRLLRNTLRLFTRSVTKRLMDKRYSKHYSTHYVQLKKGEI